MKDYKSTLNLPKTTFPMKANLSKNEPKILKFWEEINAYHIMVSSNEGKERFVLHDGPPYANGHIHLGTAMNKILKDIIIKSKNLNNKKAEYIPGWDCHGLPIEIKVEQELPSSKKDYSVIEIRQRCREYAWKYVNIQREEFKRLGVFGTWDKPYITMDPEYEAQIATELLNFVKKGSVVRYKKPIYWCPRCETALAEAEIEYYDHTSDSIYVRFPLPDPKIKELLGVDPQRTWIIIWTTTPWTLPANLAVALHPDFEYVVLEYGSEYFILAEKLMERCVELFGWKDFKVLKKFLGRELELLKAKHPIYNRDSLIVLADYVTLDVGTGCVHTAPGHGEEDYITGQKYGLDTYAPVDDKGCFTNEVELFNGLNVFEANPVIIKELEKRNVLVFKDTLTHSYPHCWRCKGPVIFRATTQWFISMDKNNLREKALYAIDNEVKWIPDWGKNRIRSMVANRPDWCISRQRSWGVPIIALRCANCGYVYCDPKWMEEIIEKFKVHKNGADFWFEVPLQDIVPEGLRCPECGGSNFKKETDILDVWFDSGSSFAAVLEKREECYFPADMYLEGSDQHRGWFHSSLLISIGTREKPPYKSVLTHGFVVDEQGRKMSKSLGNIILPQEIINKYGAEILRLWTAYEDYRDDIRISDNILKQLVDSYRRIRNTCRFILGNLYDFSKDKILPFDKMLPLDKYILDIVGEKHSKIIKAYENYEFHKVFHTIHNLCVNDLSAFYLDIIKDRLYVLAPDSLERRSAQTSLYKILLYLITDMAPILSFTAEEVYQNLPDPLKYETPTVFGLKFLEKEDVLSSEERQLWDYLTELRSLITKAIELKRKDKVVGHSLDCKIDIYVQSPVKEKIESVKEYLREFFIVSYVDIKEFEEAEEDAYEDIDFKGVKIKVEKAPWKKCARCWVYSEKGEEREGVFLCKRCVEILNQISIIA